MKNETMIERERKLAKAKGAASLNFKIVMMAEERKKKWWKKKDASPPVSLEGYGWRGLYKKYTRKS